MTELLAQLTIGFTIALTGALIPGPLALFVVATTIKTGDEKTGFLAGLGHCLVEVAIISIIILGLTTILSSPQFQIGINFVGGSTLIIFGISSLSQKIQVEKMMISKVNHNSLVGGIIFTVFNVTIPLWWATTGLMMLSRALLTTTILGVFFWVIGHWIADILWFGFLGYSVNRGKRYLGERTHQDIIKICGIIMVSLGLFFIVSTILGMI